MFGVDEPLIHGDSAVSSGASPGNASFMAFASARRVPRFATMSCFFSHA
jgi:hypothetical protein